MQPKKLQTVRTRWARWKPWERRKTMGGSKKLTEHLRILCETTNGDVLWDTVLNPDTRLCASSVLSEGDTLLLDGLKYVVDNRTVKVEQGILFEIRILVQKLDPPRSRAFGWREKQSDPLEDVPIVHDVLGECSLPLYEVGDNSIYLAKNGSWLRPPSPQYLIPVFVEKEVVDRKIREGLEVFKNLENQTPWKVIVPEQSGFFGFLVVGKIRMQ
jgi:hypothetical protein